MKKVIALGLCLSCLVNFPTFIFAQDAILPESTTQEVTAQSDDTPGSDFFEEPTSNEEESSTETETLSDTQNITPDLQFSYIIENGNVEIVEYLGTNAQVTIPELIENRPVTSLKSKLFHKNSTITNVVLPNTITQLPEFVFWNCTNLVSVTLPSSLTSIGKGAFLECTSLTNISLPETLETIQNSAFNGCSSLTQLDLPSNLKTIDSLAFYGCSKIVSAIIPDSITSFGSSVFANCTALERLQIPNSFTSIPEKTFENCTNLSTVVFPQQLETIGTLAFSNCTSLNSLILPRNLKNLEFSAFGNCTSLTSVTFSNNIVSATQPFTGCDRLNTVVFSAGVTSVASRLFMDCTGALSNITFPSSLTTVESFAFSNCTNLSYLEIPKSVTKIGQSAFSNNRNLKKITIPTNTTILESGIFSNSASVTIYCEANSTAHRYAVANNIAYTIPGAPAPTPTPPTPPAPAPVDNSITGYIQRIYEFTLSRSPSAHESTYWKQRLESGQDSGSSFVATLFFNDEFLINNHDNQSYVTFLYRAILGREPDTAGANYWISQLESGTSRPNLMVTYLSMPEFATICNQYNIQVGSVSVSAQQTANLRAFIARMYQEVLLRAPDPSGLVFWDNEMQVNGLSPYYLAHGFVFSAESLSKEQTNGDYVKMLYRSFMGRNFDSAGYIYWVTGLDSGTFSRLSVFDNFASSNEFQSIQSSFGL